MLSLPRPPTLHPSFRLLKEKIGFLCQPCVPQGSGWTWRLFPKSRGYQSVGWKVDAGVWPKQQEVSHCGLTRLSPGSAFAAACSGSEAAAHGANYSTSKHLMSDCCNLHQNEGWLLELPHRRVPHTVCLHWGSLTLLEIHYLWWLTCRALKHKTACRSGGYNPHGLSLSWPSQSCWPRYVTIEEQHVLDIVLW